MTRLILGALLFIYVQQPKPSFEAAIIKPTGMANGGVTGGCRGTDSKLAPGDVRNNVPLGRCVITAARLSHLMAIAFGLPLQRISGFPEWDGPSRFDVEAKAEDPSTTTEAQLIVMLQTFMVDRFKLTLRREMKESPIFALVVGKNGPKNLQLSQQARQSMIPSGTSLVFKGYTMQELAEFLANMPAVERPVRDRTELNGRFDFTLNVLDTKAENVGEIKMAMSRWETIFSDIQEQLGLHFESTKGPVETLIIEHAEKPASEH